MLPYSGRHAARLVLLAVGVCAAGGERLAANSAMQADQSGERSHGLAVLPPLAHSTACALAGGWCPVEEQQLPAAWANASTNSGGSHASRSRPPQEHKPLLPLSHLDVLALVLAGLSLLLAASGGIGGGGILVPLYLMVLGGCAFLLAILQLADAALQPGLTQPACSSEQQTGCNTAVCIHGLHSCWVLDFLGCRLLHVWRSGAV
jgi:hypothetical protein